MEGLMLITNHKTTGVWIQSNLKWEAHIRSITTEANRTLGLLRRNISSCANDTKAAAYASLVRPTLEYAADAWDPHPVGHVNSLEQIQRRAARFCSSDYRYTSSVSAMFSDLRWPTLESRRAVCRLVLFYKAINGLGAIPTGQLRQPNRLTRQNSGLTKTFIQIPTHCDTYRSSFFPRAVRGWAHLSDISRAKQSVESFHASAASTILQYSHC